MAAPRKQKHSQRELAAVCGVSVKTIRHWRDSEGIDLGDVQAVMARARRVDRLDDSTHGESYLEARRRRAIADANFAEIRARREAGSVVDLADVEQVFAALGGELRARLLAWRGSLVTELEGRPAEQIHRVLDGHIHELLGAIHENSKIPTP